MDELTGVRPNRLERFGTPERFGDGARSARARMARVNLTLSANRGAKRRTSGVAASKLTSTIPSPSHRQARSIFDPRALPTARSVASKSALSPEEISTSCPFTKKVGVRYTPISRPPFTSA